MISQMFNTFISPYVFVYKHVTSAIQSYRLPKEYDERTWYMLFACMTFSILILAYLLHRSVSTEDMEKNRIYLRARYYSAHRKQQKYE